jgi:pimeloyl-ACP methyl ester carboxylesterase
MTRVRARVTDRRDSPRAAALISANPSDLVHFFERGAGPPLLLIHGLMASGEMFAPILEPLAGHYRVIVPDLRGHGRSRGLPPPYTTAQMASDLSRLLEHLGIGETAVLGYSQGGAVAQQLALDDPGRCGRLVLACTYAFNMASLRERLEGHVVPLLLNVIGMKRFTEWVVTLGLKQVSRERVALVARVIASQDRRVMVAAWRAAMAFDSRPRLAEIRCPTLIVAGSSDAAVPLHHAHMLQAGISGARLVVIDGADHALLWVRPEQFVTIIREFLAQPRSP